MHDIFTFCDIHGMYDLYKAIMNYCNEQDPEATIVFIGDACDRGPDGYKIIKELLDDPQVVYLKGNHEDIFCKAAREVVKCLNFSNKDRKDIKDMLYSCAMFDFQYNAIQLALGNGGINTLADWIVDGAPMDIIEKLEQLPLTFSTEKCDFCHAGAVHSTFYRVAEAEYENRKVDEYDAEVLLWDRASLEVGWYPGRTCIFGHTPVQALEKFLEVKLEEPKPYKYIGTLRPQMTGEKIDMDTGAVFAGRAYVLNVLTMKAYGFEDKDFMNKEISKHDIEKIEVIQF